MLTDAPLARRRLLGTAATAAAGALAGCGTLSQSGGGEGPDTARTALPEGGCPSGDTPVADFYDRRLLAVDDATYGGDTLCFGTLTPYPLAHFDALEPLVVPVSETMGSAGLTADGLRRASYLKPAGDDWLVYATFTSEMDRERYRRRLDYLNSRAQTPLYNERGRYRGYARYASRLERAQAIGFGDEHFAVAPAAKGPVGTTSQRRLRRILDLVDGRARPHHCFYPAVRALLHRLPVTNVVRVWFRRDGDTYDASNHRAPAGSRIAAFTATLRYTASGEPVGARGIGAPENLRWEATLRALFSERGDLDATRRHVEADRTRVRPDSWQFGDDPTYERDGRVVRVEETRPMSALVD